VRGEPAPGSARADSASFWPDSTGTAGGDSLEALDAVPTRIAEGDSVATDPFIPMWRSFMKADDTDVGLGSEMRVRGLPGYGWTTNSVLRIEKKYFRARDMEDVSQQLTTNARKDSPGLYDVSVNMGETYSKKKTLGLARYGKDLIYDTKSATIDAAFVKPILGASSSRLSVKGGARGGTQDFKYDKSIAGGVSGAMTYELGDLVRVRAGGGASYKRETSEVGSVVFPGMPSRSDTVAVGAEYGPRANRVISVDYERVAGVERRVSPPRGSSLEILDDPSLALEEEARLNSEKLKINSRVNPFPFMAVSINFTHDVSERKHKVDTRLSNESETNNLSASTDYKFSRGGRMNITVSTADKTIDYGPLSLSSYSEKEKKAVLRAKQDITDSLSVGVTGSASLRQRFFKKREANPRDADYLRYQIEGTVEATLLPRIRTSIIGGVIRYETINIDKTLSGDNRVDYQYRLVPKIYLDPTGWLSLSQEYTIKIEYTDFVYKEDENYLDRTTTLTTNANLRVVRPLNLSIRHTYLMRDSGSYLLREGIRKYNRDNENYDYGLYIKAKYRATAEMSFIAEVDFKTQETNRLGFQAGEKVVVSSTVYDSGGLKLGVVRKRTFWGNGKIDFDINYVRRFGPYLSAERREYWIVNSSIAYTF